MNSSNRTAKANAEPKKTFKNGKVYGNALSAEEKKKIYNAVAEAQLDAWNAGSGYFYWSYKLLTDTVNTPGWVGWDSWDFGRCVDFGWFPIEK